MLAYLQNQVLPRCCSIVTSAMTTEESDGPRTRLEEQATAKASCMALPYRHARMAHTSTRACTATPAGGPVLLVLPEEQHRSISSTASTRKRNRKTQPQHQGMLYSLVPEGKGGVLDKVAAAGAPGLSVPALFVPCACC